MATKDTTVQSATEVMDPAMEYDSVTSPQYKKPNFLIGAKYKSSLLENQIMAIAFANINKGNFEETGMNTLTVTMKAAEIRNLTHSNSGSFYNRLNKVAAAMTSKSIGYNDPEQQKFEYIAVVIRATYENGYYTIEFNPYIKQYLTDIRSNFTKLKLSAMLSFDSVYSFRLYEFLKSYAYIPKNMQEEMGDKVVRFNNYFSLAELKLTLGVINAEGDGVKNVLNNSKTPNYEKAVQASQDKMYSSWTDLKRYVVDPAIEEINEKSDIFVEYRLGRAGYGGKIAGLNMTITLKEKQAQIEKDKQLSPEEKDKVIDMISDLIDIPLKVKDIRAIAEAAEYDFDLVKKTYEGAESSLDNISNFTGFMISAIKGNFYEEADTQTAKPKKKGKKDTNKFNDFKQNTYDFDQLEIDLLSN